MNCQEVDKHIYDYSQNLSSPEISKAIDKHINSCPRCKNMINITQMENIALKGNEGIPSLPDDFTKKLMYKINSKESKQTFKYSQMFFNKKIQVLSAAIILALFVPGVYHSFNLINNVDRISSSDNAQISVLEDSNGTKISLKGKEIIAAHETQEDLAVELEEILKDEQASSPTKERTNKNDKIVSNEKTLDENNDFFPMPQMPSQYEVVSINNQQADKLSITYFNPAKQNNINLVISVNNNLRSASSPGNKKEEAIQDSSTSAPSIMLYTEDLNEFKANDESIREENKVYSSEPEIEKYTWSITINEVVYYIELEAKMGRSELLELVQNIHFK